MHTRDRLFDVGGLAILVAGGAGGLGTAIVRELAVRGARVVVADVDQGRAEAVATQVSAASGEVRGISLNVTDSNSCKDAVDFTIGAFGRLDALVNASGVYRVSPALEMTDDDWERTIDINLTGAFRLARAAGRAMIPQRSGSIVTVTSVSSKVSNPNYAAYAASKAGAAHVTRILALEWASTGIRVNALGPAVTPTPLTTELFEDAGAVANALAKIPMGRFGTPEDLLGAVLFMLSPASMFMTGQVIYVDGGRTIF